MICCDRATLGAICRLKILYDKFSSPSNRVPHCCTGASRKWMRMNNWCTLIPCCRRAWRPSTMSMGSCRLQSNRRIDMAPTVWFSAPVMIGCSGLQKDASSSSTWCTEDSCNECKRTPFGFPQGHISIRLTM